MMEKISDQSPVAGGFPLTPKKNSPKKSPVAIGHQKKHQKKKPPSGSPSVAAGHKRPAPRSPSMANSSATTQGPWHRDGVEKTPAKREKEITNVAVLAATLAAKVGFFPILVVGFIKKNLPGLPASGR